MEHLIVSQYVGWFLDMPAKFRKVLRIFPGANGLAYFAAASVSRIKVLLHFLFRDYGEIHGNDERGAGVIFIKPFLV